MLNTGIIEMQGVYHQTGAFIIPDGSESFVEKFMKTKAAKAFSWPKHRLMGDEHKGFTKLRANHFY
jgi:hypothetical protein